MDEYGNAMTRRDLDIPATLERIEGILTQANDQMSPQGQSQAGIQLAQVEVPWLVRTVERLITAARVNELRIADPHLEGIANPPELARLYGLEITGTLGRTG